MQGKKVVVVALDKDREGREVATLKLASGRRFFRTHPQVTARIEQAFDSGELLAL